MQGRIRTPVIEISKKLSILPSFRDKKNRYYQFVNSQIPRFIGTFYKYQPKFSYLIIHLDLYFYITESFYF